MNTPTNPVRGVERRTVLATGLGAGVVGVTAVAVPASSKPFKPFKPSKPGPARPAAGDYFRHGVASGDPLPDRVVLWTRVTPTPDATPGSSLGPDVQVTWQVSADAGFKKVVAQGMRVASRALDHTVKVDARGLRPARWYYYRFAHAGRFSPVGRTRTAPAADSRPANLRLGVVSCANLQAGWFSAYRHLASRDDLHAVLHLGDYLYEYAPGRYGHGNGNVDIRSHQPAREMVTLADYRQRHAQYKTDPDLQALHARYPFIVTWDDHETTNDVWREGAENHQPDEGDFLVRRTQAHRAYDEWMPVRLEGTAEVGDGNRLYRRLQFGRLAELSMLDLRTYRDQQLAQPGPEVSDPDRTITGAEQLSWLKESLTRPASQWKLVGNPVMIAPVTFGSLPDNLVDPVADVTGLLPRDGVPYNVDQWDGYTDDRRELFAHIRDNGVKDVVFLTGDIHSAWACDLPYDASTYPAIGDSAGVEFVCTSVTSNNLDDITGTPPRTTSLAVEAGIQANNRHVRYLNFDDHGFSVLDVTPAGVQMDYFVIGDRRDPATGASRTASYRTEAATGRVVPTATPIGG